MQREKKSKGKKHWETKDLFLIFFVWVFWGNNNKDNNKNNDNKKK